MTTSRRLWRTGSLLAVFVCWLLMSPATWSAETKQARIIVKWKATETRTRTQTVANVRSEFRQATGLSLNTRRSISERMDVMQLEQPLDQQQFAQALDKLRAQAEVEYAVPDIRRHIAALPNDPLFTATSGRTGQWYLQKTEVASINAFDAWDFSQGGSSGSGVVVAVVDTGVRFDHPDLTGKLLPGYDFVDCDQTSCTGAGAHTFLTANDGDGWDADASDPGDWVSSTDLQDPVFADCETGSSSWHGTRVSGLIGANTNNNIGIAGTGWNARILPIRALGKCGGYDSDIIAGMRWAAGLAVSGVPANPNPAKVINLSLGGEGACDSNYIDVIAELTAAGVSVVASAGNEGGSVNTPANCNGVIGVVGVRHAGSKVGFSSLGSDATLAAPAGNCVNTTGACLFPIDTTTNLGATTPTFNNYSDQTNPSLGTSFSAPIVSGTVALMLGRNPALLPSQIKTRLQASSKAFPTISGVTACHIPTSNNDIQDSECNCTRATCGAGLTDANAAVLSADQFVVPYIRGGTTVRTNGSVTLDAAGSTLSENLASYVWSLQSGNGMLSGTTGSSITVTAPTAPGAINLLLTISDGAGNSGAIPHTINVYGPPTARITGNTTVVAGQNVTLNGSTSSAQDGGYLTYAWTSSSGALSSSTGSTVTLTAPTTTSSVNVTLTVTDQLGSSASQNLTISVTGTNSGTSSSSSSSGGSGGGGGALHWQELLYLLALWLCAVPLMGCQRGKTRK